MYVYSLLTLFLLLDFAQLLNIICYNNYVNFLRSWTFFKNKNSFHTMTYTTSVLIFTNKWVLVAMKGKATDKILLVNLCFEKNLYLHLFCIKTNIIMTWSLMSLVVSLYATLHVLLHSRENILKNTITEDTTKKVSVT